MQYMKNKALVSGGMVLMISFVLAGSAFAMETGTAMQGDSMMKHDGAMMKSDTLMKGDSMMSSGAMMGSSGTDVVSLQTVLEDKGYLMIPKGVARGYFGALTKVALMKLQASYNVPETGSVDQLTNLIITIEQLKKKLAELTAMKGKTMMKDDAMMMKKDDHMMGTGGDAMMH